MPRLDLTKRNIDKLEFTEKGKAIDYWDTGLKGFGMRVGEKTKTFMVKVDVKTTSVDKKDRPYKTVKSIIGRYGEWTPEQARKEASERLKSLKMGNPAKPLFIPTLSEMLETHLQDNRFSPVTEKAYRSQVPAKFRRWMDLPLDEVAAISPDVMIDCFKQVEKDSGAMAAKNVFGKLQAIMNYARVRYPASVPSNPCSVLTAAKLWPKTNSRDDCLKGNDFKQFYNGVQSFNEITRDAFLFCLYQGLRNSEAASLKWQFVDLANGILTIPGRSTETQRGTKNKRTLRVPLSSQSLEILKRRNASGIESEFVFPSVGKEHLNKTGHVVLKSELLKLKTGLDISIHGLRRTFITTGERLKLRRQDVDKLTNHVDRSVTAEHYDRTDAEDLRAPLQAICNEIERLMKEGVGAKVVVLPTAAVKGQQ